MDVLTMISNLWICPWCPSVNQRTEDNVSLLENVLTKSRVCWKFQVCVVQSDSPQFSSLRWMDWCWGQLESCWGNKQAQIFVESCFLRQFFKGGQWIHSINICWVFIYLLSIYYIYIHKSLLNSHEWIEFLANRWIKYLQNTFCMHSFGKCVIFGTDNYVIIKLMVD